MIASRNSTESTGDPLIVTKVWLIVSGIYIWEFITTLDFEWSVIRRHQPYRWTIWIYSVSRLSGLVVIILNLVNFYNTTPIDCQAWVTSGWVFSTLGGYALSSILIMLRIWAIWDRNTVIMAISAAICFINVGVQLLGIVKINAVWLPATSSCSIANVETHRVRILSVSMLVTDILLLSIMLAGLLRLRRGAGSFHLSRLLWKQGVIWLAIATAAEFPQMLLLFLNVNGSLNVLFLLPSLVAIIIAATRTYRSLIHSALRPDSHPGEPDSSNSQRARRLVSHTKDSSVVHIPSNRLDVTVHTGRAYHEEYPMSQTDHYSSYPRVRASSDAQSTDKPHGLGLDDIVEGRDEKR